MDKELKDFKCPNCGNRIHFDSSIQKLKCDFCNETFEIEDIDQENEIKTEETKNDNFNSYLFKKELDNKEKFSKEEEESLVSYVCKSCGGEIICEKTTVATSCPYCQSPVVMTNNVKGLLKPDYIIPFKLDKNAALESLKKHLQHKMFLPKDFKTSNHLNEIKSLYVPFWLFDVLANGKATYNTTRVNYWQDLLFRYTETSYYKVYREGSSSFQMIPADASLKMNDDLMDSIEPFNYNDKKIFNIQYLAGFLADKYDVSKDSESIRNRIYERVKNSLEYSLRNSVNNYTSVNKINSEVSISNYSIKYILLPVWILNTTYNNNHYIFAMNGETGKFVGNLPCDNFKYFSFITILFLIFSLAIFFIEYFYINGSNFSSHSYYFFEKENLDIFKDQIYLLLFPIILGILFSVGIATNIRSRLKTVKKKTEATIYMKNLDIYKKTDLFLYKNITKSKIETSANNMKNTFKTGFGSSYR